jgi:hypothetical protein
MFNSNRTRIIASVAMAFLTTLFAAPMVSADIIKIQSSQSCNVIGLDPSPGASVGGVHCDVGNTPFKLTDILNGGLPLFVGNSSTPSWNVINNTGSLLTSLTLSYSGALAPGAFIDMQISGTTLFHACAETTGANITFSDSSCGTHDIASSPAPGPLTMVWSGGTGVAANGVFNIGTASFAHAGADAGCISGTSNCAPVVTPEPSTFVLSGLGLTMLLVGQKWRKLRKISRSN